MNSFLLINVIMYVIIPCIHCDTNIYSTTDANDQLYTQHGLMRREEKNILHRSHASSLSPDSSSSSSSSPTAFSSLASLTFASPSPDNGYRQTSHHTLNERESKLVRKTLGPLKDFSMDLMYNEREEEEEKRNTERVKETSSPYVTLEWSESSPSDTILPIVTPPVTRVKQLDEQCSLPKKQGSCGARMLRYTYDIQTNKCHQFIYSGCNGNGNNFIEPADCIKACQAIGIVRLPINQSV